MKLRRFLGLVHNEHEKMYSKKSIWACYIFLFALCLLFAVLPRLVTSDFDPHFWEYMQSVKGLSGFIMMMVIVIGATNISSEYQKGTIKLLLIRPNKRWKILLSKYIATFIFLFEMLASLLIFATILGLIFQNGHMDEALEISTFGFDGIYTFTPDNMWIYIIKEYLFDLVSLVVLINFGLMLSCLFRSNAVAIGMTMLLYFVGTGITQLLFGLKVSWAKYVIFANMDLRDNNLYQQMDDSITLQFSVTVILVYLVIFTVTSWFSFTKRDVGA